MKRVWCWFFDHNDFRLGDFNVCRRCGRSYKRLTNDQIIREALRVLGITLGASK